MESRNRNHQVLLTGFDDQVAVRIVATLSPFGVDFHRVPWNESLSGIVSYREFDVILFRCPARSQDLIRIMEVLRADDAFSRHAGIVAFADPLRIDWVRRHVGRGINRVLALDASPDTLREAVLSLLDVARRFQLRAPVQLSVECIDRPTTAHCHTENLSMSGMLVSCSHLFPVGSPLEFALSFPGEEQPIRGKATVARVTDPKRERVLGIGASFVEFSENHRSRLRSLLLRRAS
jgi:uncharacterized protein (TIGR02266 family)